ncbi:MAG: zf-HC2 domain-containing protein [Verrucomicrobia bacterium]|nr:zf-HC2 domain-containing protein [Verrucomicrobiota bacterium]
MNHPTHEEIVSHFYGELPPARRAELTTHLADCPECRATAEELRSVMSELDGWKLPAPRRRVRIWAQPALQWAVAAAIAVAVGIGIGRFTAPRADATAVRALVQGQIDQLARGYDAKREEDRAAIVDILKTMQTRHDTDLATLRRALETVAVNAENGFRSAAFQIGELAGIAQPAANLPSSRDNK